MVQDGKIELIADWLEKQLADSEITDGRIWQELAVSERTFYRLKPRAQEVLEQRLAERQRILEGVKAKEIAESAKQGIKTKTERILILQNQVDELLIDLTDPDVSVTDKAYLRKAIKEIQSEISKIEGDYAPTTSITQNTHTDITKLTDEQIDERINQLSGGK